MDDIRKIRCALEKLDYSDDEIEKRLSNITKIELNEENLREVLAYALDSILYANNESADASAGAVKTDEYEYVIIIESETKTLMIIYDIRSGEFAAYESLHI